MFARVLTVKGRTGMADQVVKLYEERVIGAMAGIRGMRHAYLLWDDQTNDVLSVALYDSREDLDADTPAMQQRVIGFRQLMAGEPTVRVYEVLVHGSR
jgi:hypothetical protein